MARFVKVATLTVNPIPEIEIDREKPLYDSVIAYLEKQLKSVLCDKPDLIVLPEHCGRQTTFPERKMEYINGETLRLFEYFKKVAKENNCYISFSRYKKMSSGVKGI